MSAILGIFTPKGRTPDERAAGEMLARMSARGREHTGVARGDGALLAVARHDWEMGDGFSGPLSVLEEHDLVIAADASLYYRSDLRRAIEGAGVRLSGATPSHLILGAYRAWGERCAERLEGDVAFILYDRVQRRLTCARDFVGVRPLFYAELGDTLVVASAISALLAYPGCPNDLNLTVVAENAAGLFAEGHETCYRAIRALPAGCTLVREPEGRTRLRRHWDVPAIEVPSDAAPAERAADELRHLLTRAVAERMAEGGATSVWMSGGYDSTAIFGVGQHFLEESGRAADELRIVSISYPPGDRGREDELIRTVADRWQSGVHWLDIADIPLLDRAVERAAAREEPFAHMFETWNRALVRGSRAVDSRVALQGNGGDQLFNVSDSYLADLLRRGRWLALAREWRAKGVSRFQYFFDYAVRPALPPAALRAAGLLRGGRPLAGFIEQRAPAWMNARFLHEHGIAERERCNAPRRARQGAAASEMYWVLTYPLFPKVVSSVHAFGLDGGVEARAPLLDERVLKFAVSRPVSERCAGAETKLLLRRAMRGLLPDELLAARKTRTGVTSDYFDRSLRRIHHDLFVDAFTDPVLGELGIVDPAALRRSWDAYVRDRYDNMGGSLFLTMQTELWLRARLRRADAAPDSSPAPALAAAS